MEPEAEQVLFALKLGKAPSENEKNIKTWAVSYSVSARKSQYMKKALFAFLTSVGFTAMTTFGGYLYEPNLQALKDKGYMEVYSNTDENGIEYE